MSYCSQCELVHGEEHRFCQRCGQILKRVPPSPRACPRCGALTYPGQKFCTDCGLPLKALPAEDEPAAPRRPPVFYPRSDKRPTRRRRPGLAFLVVFLIFLGAAGFYGWRYLIKSPATPAISGASAPKEDLRREVERVAEKIRAAHINEDINKFLHCYSPSYPNLGGLENQILQLWKKYDIKEVSYRISEVTRLGDRQAQALLVWNIQVYDPQTHDYMLLRPAYRITLEKTGDGWKIRESREEGG
ncbi:MAG: zinc ribbon domain-containing protein [Deltaproteobacteria bacterium]|nr:zinc ribbon domain-containing protein [Deltaproteobacteria bacterium]